jgi:AraC-like DNA-binding protein
MNHSMVAEVKMKMSEKQALCDYIINKLTVDSGNVSLTGLARETGYSRQYINRVFQEKIGISVMRFGKILRIHKLLHRLKDSGKWGVLSQLSCDFGFADQSHMIREFKKYVGVTPLQFLASHKEEAKCLV